MAELELMRATGTDTNVASARLLAEVGFRRVVPADARDVGGKHGSWFELALTLHPAG